MKFIGLRGVWTHTDMHACKHTRTQAAWQPTAGPELHYWWRWLINLWKWLSHMPDLFFFFNQHNFFPLLYHRGETTDQSRLSATWQRGKSERVIEKVSRPHGAVSVACLSIGRHWWTVEAEKAPHTHMPSHYRGLKHFLVVPHRGTGSARFRWDLSVWNNVLWEACSWMEHGQFVTVYQHHLLRH